MEILLFALLLALLVVVPLWGTDTRDGRDWQPRGDWQSREEIHRARARADVR
jgi:hypothetical protein